MLDTVSEHKLMMSNDRKLILNTVLTTFNDGKNGGIALLKPLTDIINKLQKKVNDLSDAFDTHVHIGVSTGGSVSGIPKNKAPARIEVGINIWHQLVAETDCCFIEMNSMEDVRKDSVRIWRDDFEKMINK